MYEGQLFTIFKTPMLTELAGGSPAAIEWQGNLGLAAFLLGGAVGGMGFGVLGDRFGRVRIMAYTILVYSLFSALTAFATSTLQVLVLRFLVALGAGGEWAIAAALVAETFPAHARAAASGIFHASSVLGSALASLTGMIFVGPGTWRWGFVMGLAPALLVLWIRVRHEPEPDRWIWLPGVATIHRRLRPRGTCENSSVRHRGDRERFWGWLWPPSAWRLTGESSPGARSSSA